MMKRRDFLALLATTPFSYYLYGDSFSIKDINTTNQSKKVDLMVHWFIKQRLPKIIVRQQGIQEAIKELALPFFRVSNRKVDWKIFVVNEKNVNAYTLGGGLICVDINLIKSCHNETELVSVIAHEVGHVHYKHAERRLTKDALFQQLDINKLGRLNVEVLGKSYKRLWEHEADAFIVKAFLETDYSIAQASSFFKKLERFYPSSSNINDCIFSTHPQHKNRIGKLDAIASTNSQFEFKTEDSEVFKFLKKWSHS